MEDTLYPTHVSEELKLIVRLTQVWLWASTILNPDAAKQPVDSQFFFSMDNSGQAEEFRYSDLARNKDLNFPNFTKQMVLEMCDDWMWLSSFRTRHGNHEGTWI